MRKESETVFCSKCVREGEGGNVEMDFHEGCMFQGAEHQVTEMPWVSKNTLQCESLHVTAPNLDFTYSADNFIPLVSANVVNERRGNDLAPVCFKLRLYELAASVELRSHREELWAEKERWDLGWVREGGCRGGVSLPVPALRYCVSSLGTLHRSRLLNSNQWHQDRRGGRRWRERGRESDKKKDCKETERERVRKARHGEGGGMPSWQSCCIICLMVEQVWKGRRERREEAEAEIYWRMLWGSMRCVMWKRSR